MLASRRALAPGRRSVAPRATADVDAARSALLAAARGTARGGRATRADRGAVEDAILALERAAATAAADGAPPPAERLAGRWRLAYTTAADVAPLLAASSAAAAAADAVARLLPRPPVPAVGNIYQQFGAPADGRVANIIELALPPALEGLTITVAASYTVTSPRRVALTFKSASAGRATLTPGAEAAIAPALLPRGTLQLAVLQAFKSKVTVPLQGALPAALSPLNSITTAARRAAGGEYLISFVDDSVLVGRQTGAGPAGGVFVFERVDDGEWVGAEDEGWA